MRRWLVWSVLLSLVIAGVFVAPHEVAAQSLWCADFDFSTGTNDWAARVVSGNSYASFTGTYWEAVTLSWNSPPANDDSAIEIVRSGDSGTINSITTWYTGEPNTHEYEIYMGATLQDTITGSASGSEVGFADVSFDNIMAVLYNTSGAGMTLTRIKLKGSGANPFGADTCSTGGGGGGIVKPLAGDDIHEQWGIYDLEYAQSLDEDIETNDPYTVFAFSNAVDSPVNSVADGTVISVTPYRQTDCPVVIQTFGSFIRRCSVVIPQVITQETGGYIFNLEILNTSRVLIQDAEDEAIVYEYLLQNATVKVGDSVVAGCIIGQVIQLKNVLGVELASITGDVGASITDTGPSVSIGFGGTVDLRSLLVDSGVTFLWRIDTDEVVSLAPELTLNPNQTNCRDETLSGCVNASSDLKQPGAWAGSIAAFNPEGGALLKPYGDYLFQNGITVDADTDYMLTIQAGIVNDNTESGSYPIQVQVGTQSELITLTTTLQNYSFEPTNPITTSGSETEIWIFNDPNLSPDGGTADVFITYVCLAPATASIEPGSCYFANHQFELNGTGWNPFGTIAYGSGQAYMSNDAVLEQAVRLEPGTGGPHDYEIQAQVRLQATADYTGQVGKSATIEYRFPEGGSYTGLGTIDSALVNAEGLNTFDGLVNLNHPYILTDTLTVSSSTTGLFSFKTTITDTSSYITALRVDWFCIRPTTDDGSFPGQDGGGGFSAPFVEACATVPIPADNSVGSWTYYHWKNVQRVFECDLMRLLNKQFAVLDNFQKTARYFMRYTIAVIQYLGSFTGDVTLWLNGHFRNIAIGQVTTVYSGEEQCNNLFCVLTAGTGLIGTLLDQLSTVLTFVLGLVTQSANLLFTVLVSVIGLLVSMLTYILNLLLLGQRALIGIVGAYNSATPVPIPGVPSCAGDPRDSGFCVFFWMADNTVFSGPGELIVPLLVSIFSIHLLIWVAIEIKKVVSNVGAVA